MNGPHVSCLREHDDVFPRRLDLIKVRGSVAQSHGSLQKQSASNGAEKRSTINARARLFSPESFDG
jgi:hypothetical protein